jgi:hypothetical protein
MQLAEERAQSAQITIRLTPELSAEVSARAKDTGLSVNRAVAQLLRAGIEAERNKKRQLEDLLRRYRESQDPEETKRLGDELGAMIFGQ